MRSSVRAGVALVLCGLCVASPGRAAELVFGESAFVTIPMLDGRPTSRLNAGLGLDNRVGWRFELGLFELTPELSLGLTSIPSNQAGLQRPPDSGLLLPDFLFLQPGVGAQLALATRLRPAVWVRGNLALGSHFEFTGGYQAGAALDWALRPGLRLGARAAFTSISGFYYPDLYEGYWLSWWSLGAQLELAL